MISMRVVQNLIKAVSDAGVPRSAFLRSARLEPAFVQTSDAWLPRSKLYELMELALELTGDPAFGLHSLERLSSQAVGPIAALVAHAPTLRDAITAIRDFRRSLGDEASFRIHEESGKVYVQINSCPDQSAAVRRFIAEIAVGGLFRALARARVEAHIADICFEYEAPSYHPEYTRFFKRRTRFEQAFTGLRFESELLDRRAPYPDPELYQALRTFAERRLSHVTNRQSCAARVRQLLMWQPPPRDVTMPAVAAALRMSERSLRRQLQAEGKSYREVVDEALAFIAKRCLLDDRLTIAETAAELGFADSTAFHRAFKRWTGVTPTQYRKQLPDAFAQLRS